MGVLVREEAKVFFESEGILGVHAETHSDTIIVTFNELTTTANGNSFWGDRLLAGLDVTGIGFVSTTPNWYPREDMLRAIDAARSLISGRRVVTYGYSQGAYGALKYGAHLSASAAVAFSPQWSINPIDVGKFDSRFSKFYEPGLANGERIEAEDLCERNYVVVDRWNRVDAANIEKLIALGSVVVIPCPFADHGTLAIITDAHLGNDLVRLMVDDRALRPQALRTLVRRGRTKSLTYQRYRAAQLSASRTRHQRFASAAAACMSTALERVMAQVELHLATSVSEYGQD